MEDMKKEDELLSVAFNQDNTRLVCASNNGAQVFNCSNLEPDFSWTSNKGGTGVQMAAIDGKHRLFLVGGGEFPFLAPDEFRLWDDLKHSMQRVKWHKGSGLIKGLQVISDAFAIVLEDEVHAFYEGNIVRKHNTIFNPSGICAMSPGDENGGVTVATLGLRVGEVLIYRKRSKAVVAIQAHKSALKFLALSQDGSLLATASNKGTLIRIFNTIDGSKLQELRRGSDAAQITSLALSPDNRWLVLTSDKHTVHLFSLNCTEEASSQSTSSSQGSVISRKVANPSSRLSFIGGVLPSYFSSEWSFAQFRLPTRSRAVAVFSHEEINTIFVACYNGSFHKLKFDPFKSGEMEEVQTATF